MWPWLSFVVAITHSLPYRSEKTRYVHHPLEIKKKRNGARRRASAPRRPTPQLTPRLAGKANDRMGCLRFQPFLLLLCHESVPALIALVANRGASWRHSGIAANMNAASGGAGSPIGTGGGAPADEPSTSLPPIEVVQAAMKAWRANEIQTVITFTSPQNRRAVRNMEDFELILRSSSAFKHIIFCYKFEVLSALSIGESEWQCRVRIEASEDRRLVGARTLAKYYRWDLSRQSKPVSFGLGQCLRHRKYEYRGVVIGWDDQCKQSADWCEQMRVDELDGGRSQPFYHVLVDGRDRPGGQQTYVAQENIAPVPVQPVDHPSFAQPLFTGEIDEDEGTWLLNPIVRAQHPKGLEGCWLVDGVVPDLDQPEEVLDGDQPDLSY